MKSHVIIFINLFFCQLFGFQTIYSLNKIFIPTVKENIKFENIPIYIIVIPNILKICEAPRDDIYESESSLPKQFKKHIQLDKIGNTKPPINVVNIKNVKDSTKF